MGRLKHNPRSPEQRFWEKVDKRGPDECWGWTASKTYGGYGVFSVYGKDRLAHRFSYELHNGEIPVKMCVCHRCDNPACCNPSHFFLGTLKQNHDDMVSKGRRTQVGVTHHAARLSELDVREIRAETVLGVRQMADKYRVSKDLIYRIRKGQVWKHLL